MRELTFRLICIPDARSLDPDNDFRRHILTQGDAIRIDRDKTNNWIKYQKGYAAYQHPTQPDTAMVCACGMEDFKSVVCMAAVHPDVVALSGGHLISHIVQLEPRLNNEWIKFGGKYILNDPAHKKRMKYADESIHLLFNLGSLAPGESTTFTTGQILHADQMSKTIGALGGVKIVQPTDLMGGTSVPFVVGECTRQNPLRVCSFLTNRR